MTVQAQPVNGKRAKTIELIKDLLALRSIFIKFGVDDYTNDALFVEMANELGFTSTLGRPLSYMGYRQMMDRMGKWPLLEILQEMEEEPIVVFAARDYY